MKIISAKIKIEAGSDFQAKVIFTNLDAIFKEFTAFYETTNKKNKIEWEIITTV